MVFVFMRSIFICAGIAGAMRITEEGDQEELIVAEMEDTLEEEQQVFYAESAPDSGQLALEMLKRQCIQEEAEEFCKLMESHGYPKDGVDHDQLTNDIVGYWQISDLQQNHLSSYNVIMRQIVRRRDEKQLEFTAALQNITNRFEEVGFSYAGAETRCDEDGTSQVRECIVARATEFGELNENPSLPDLVHTRISLRDVQVHQPPNFNASELDTVTDRILAAGFDFHAMRTQCRERAQERAVESIEHAQVQLRSPAPNISYCHEEPDATFCPEGTALIVNRPTNVIRGTAAFTTTYFAAWPVITVVAPALTAMTGLGFGLGLAFAMGPFPHGAIFGSMAYAIFSNERRTCMCFPQDCHYDDSTGSCGLSADGMSESNNPFSHAMPFMSSKCVPSLRANATCEMQACGETDFAPPLGEFDGAPLFGTVGQENGGLYNCLSDNGGSSGSLLIKTTLPGEQGQPNIPANRNRIFEGLDLN